MPLKPPTALMWTAVAVGVCLLVSTLTSAPDAASPMAIIHVHCNCLHVTAWVCNALLPLMVTAAAGGLGALAAEHPARHATATPMPVAMANLFRTR
jgi:hypothetical protein